MKHFSLLIVFVCFFCILRAQNMVIEVAAGSHARENAPMFVRLAKPLSTKVEYQLTNQKTGAILPAQLKDSITLVFIPEAPIAAGTTNVYTLKAGVLRPGVRFKHNVIVEEQSNGLLVKVKNKVEEKPLFFYHTATAKPPAGNPDYYRRSGFIHPLYSPDGNILTDDFPAGHMHQHGIFMTWVNTTFRGQAVDFWNQHSQKGTVEHAEIVGIKKGPVFTSIKTKLRHISLAHGPILEETWTITIYPFTDYFLFDLESEQVNITADTLFLNKYHYGGLAFRGSKEWNSHDSLNFKNSWQILTSEGNRDSSANHTRARWVDASGKLKGKLNGLTILNHPDNFRYPQSIRVHPEMPYWCYAPMVDGAFTLSPGKLYRSRFRFFVHAGGADVSAIEKEAKNFVEAVQVKIK